MVQAVVAGPVVGAVEIEPRHACRERKDEMSWHRIEHPLNSVDDDDGHYYDDDDDYDYDYDYDYDGGYDYDYDDDDVI